MLCSVSLQAGAGLKSSSTLLVRPALFFHPPDFWFMPLRKNYPWRVKLSVNFSSPDSLWKNCLNKLIGSLRCILDSGIPQPAPTPFFSKVLTVLIMFIYNYESVFFSLYSDSTSDYNMRGSVKATCQISPLKWYVLAGEMCSSSVPLRCNQREWCSDCDSHHYRLMANQTGGLPTLIGSL